MSGLELVTQALEDLKATEHLDEDWAIPCQVIKRDGSDQCQMQAEWLGWRVLCCPDAGTDNPVSLWCTSHKDEVLAATFIGECDFCHRVYRPYRTGFRLIEPLNRRPQ